MTPASLTNMTLEATAAALAGLLLGLIYFAALRHTVRAFMTRRGWFVPISLTVARVVGTGVTLAAAAHFGAMQLLAAFLGFLIARGISIGAQRRSA